MSKVFHDSLQSDYNNLYKEMRELRENYDALVVENQCLIVRNAELEKYHPDVMMLKREIGPEQYRRMKMDAEDTHYWRKKCLELQTELRSLKSDTTPTGN